MPVWTGRNDRKSAVWWTGFHNGQDSTGNAPEKEAAKKANPQEKADLSDEIVESARRRAETKHLSVDVPVTSQCNLRAGARHRLAPQSSRG